MITYHTVVPFPATASYTSQIYESTELTTLNVPGSSAVLTVRGSSTTSNDTLGLSFQEHQTRVLTENGLTGSTETHVTFTRNQTGSSSSSQFSFTQTDGFSASASGSSSGAGPYATANSGLITRATYTSSGTQLISGISTTARTVTSTTNVGTVGSTTTATLNATFPYSAAGTQTLLQYDVLDRLTTIGTTVKFTADAFGNPMQRLLTVTEFEPFELGFIQTLRAAEFSKLTDIATTVNVILPRTTLSTRRGTIFDTAIRGTSVGAFVAGRAFAATAVATVTNNTTTPTSAVLPSYTCGFDATASPAFSSSIIGVSGTLVQETYRLTIHGTNTTTRSKTGWSTTTTVPFGATSTYTYSRTDAVLVTTPVTLLSTYQNFRATLNVPTIASTTAWFYYATAQTTSLFTFREQTDANTFHASVLTRFTTLTLSTTTVLSSVLNGKIPVTSDVLITHASRESATTQANGATQTFTLSTIFDSKGDASFTYTITFPNYSLFMFGGPPNTLRQIAEIDVLSTSAMVWSTATPMLSSGIKPASNIASTAPLYSSVVILIEPISIAVYELTTTQTNADTTKPGGTTVTLKFQVPITSFPFPNFLSLGNQDATALTFGAFSPRANSVTDFVAYPASFSSTGNSSILTFTETFGTFTRVFTVTDKVSAGISETTITRKYPIPLFTAGQIQPSYFDTALGHFILSTTTTQTATMRAETGGSPITDSVFHLEMARNIGGTGIPAYASNQPVTGHLQCLSGPHWLAFNRTSVDLSGISHRDTTVLTATTYVSAQTGTDYIRGTVGSIASLGISPDQLAFGMDTMVAVRHGIPGLSILTSNRYTTTA